MAGNLVPRTDGGSSLGTASKEYNKVYAKDLGGTVAGLYAKLASPTFTGTPTAPTASVGTATTQIATTKFVNDAVNSTIHYRQESTPYNLGDMEGHSSLPYGWYLECTTAGTTDSGALTITTPTVGDTITDGTCMWTIRRTASVANGVFNKKETFTSSGSFTAPYTGTYRITIQAGGGGGASGQTSTYGNRGGGGGAEGAHMTFYAALTAGTSYSYTIGAGGAGGTVNGQNGSNGGNTTITINTKVYLAYGGSGGLGYGGASAGASGSGAFIDSTLVQRCACGDAGGSTSNTGAASAIGGNGGGVGGGVGALNGGQAGFGGGGGAGGGYNATGAGITAGGAGGDGYITFEYCDI